MAFQSATTAVGDFHTQPRLSAAALTYADCWKQNTLTLWRHHFYVFIVYIVCLHCGTVAFNAFSANLGPVIR